MTSNRFEIKLQQLLENIPVPKTSKRLDCPNCGGHNTLSITNLGTIVLFYCFRASCNLKGKSQVDLSIDTVKKAFQPELEKKEDAFSLDDFLFMSEITGKGRIEKYLQDNNCWEAYQNGRADIRYDPYEDRVVFMIYANDGTGHPKSAVGRRLGGTGSKWKRYGKKSLPFICPKELEADSDTLVIVEDSCSACAASSCHDSAALLGTFLQASYLGEFLNYKKFILALDKDASKLAFKMQRELQYYRPTKILLLEEDLKALKLDKIRRLFDV